MKINFKILRLVLFIFLILPFKGMCQDITLLLKEAVRLESVRKENEAFTRYLEVLKVQPDNLVALCKAGELSCLIGNRESQKSMKLTYFKAARRYAETALRINSNYAEANFVMAMAMGRMALVLSGREKIHAVNDIKKYAENAVRNDPLNFKAFHVLGKWHYEVSNLSSFERMAAKVLFGGIPASSFSESIKYYEKSRSLKPDFALNYLEMARAYYKNEQEGKAIEFLLRLQPMQVRAADDIRIKKEGNELLKKIRN